jgi:hypothetical protein
VTSARFILYLAAALLALQEARSAPLEAEGCARLKDEQGRLEQAGVRGNMGKGPEWAKANLATDKLAAIRRLIEVDEQLLFRCSSGTLVRAPPEEEPDPPPPAADAKKAAKHKAGAAKKAPARKAPAPAKKSKAAAKKAPAARADK